MTIDLMIPSSGYKPFRYGWAFEYWQKQQQVHWLPEELTKIGDDVTQWNSELLDIEKNFVMNTFRYFTQADVNVLGTYTQNYLQLFKPVEIQMMLAAFSNMESVHIHAYSYLIETLGLPVRS